MTQARGAVLVATLALVGLTACAGNGSGAGDRSSSTAASPSAVQSTSSGFQANGTLILSGPNSGGQTGEPGTACSGTGGYADIAAGAQVTVTGASGQTLGLGKLGDGVVGKDNAGTPQRTCEFYFSVIEIPMGEKFYGIKVAGRDGPQFPESEISTTTVTLTLGS